MPSPPRKMLRPLLLLSHHLPLREVSCPKGSAVELLRLFNASDTTHTGLSDSARIPHASTSASPGVPLPPSSPGEAPQRSPHNCQMPSSSSERNSSSSSSAGANFVKATLLSTSPPTPPQSFVN